MDNDEPTQPGTEQRIGQWQTEQRGSVGRTRRQVCSTKFQGLFTDVAASHEGGVERP